MLPFLRQLLVHFGDDLLKRLLQMRRIVNLEHQLPRRRRQHGAIDGEGILATQRRREIVPQVQAVVLLQVIKMLIQIRTNLAHHRE